MVLRRTHVAALILALMALNACEGRSIREAQYWQRVNASEAAYIQGPKAQQMLHRDIAACVTDLRELERLGTLRNAIPVDANGKVLDPDEYQLRDQDTPERDNYLLAEQGEYHDFETCMLTAGWERVEYLPYDMAERARGNYPKTIRDYQYQSRVEERKLRQVPGNNSAGETLNE